MAVEIGIVCTCTLFLALQSAVVSSKDDSGCSYLSSTENLQRPGTLRDRLNELPGAKKGFLRQSWKISVDENQQNNALQDGDDSSQDGGWSSPNQKIWGKRAFGSETGELERRYIKLCESEKRKWGRNNQKVWGKRDEPDQTKQEILGAELLGYRSGKELTDGDMNFEPADYERLETDSDDGFKLPKEEKKAWGHNKAKVWGKRGVYHEDKQKLDQNKAMLWEDRVALQNDVNKRKWGQSKAMVWGKREGLLMDEEKRKWGQNKAMVWGKRDELPADEEKRKWGQNKAMVWGKRDESSDKEEKRKWGQSKAMVWGKRDDLLIDEDKRKWGQNKAMVWGKRDGLVIDEEKRKWGQNKAKVWGKREVIEDQQKLLRAMEPLIQDLNSDVKRKWGDNKAKVWGKRNTQAEEKRKWGNNNAKVWGKRDDLEEEKRQWGNNKAKVWGKRDDIEEEKRKWGNNKAKVWGKRDEFAEEKRKWGNNKARVWGKRQNQDDASIEPITNAAASTSLDKSEDALEESKRKWAQNKAKVWGKRDVSSVFKKQNLERKRVKALGKQSDSTNLIEEMKSEKVPASDTQRRDLTEDNHNSENGTTDLLHKITTKKIICVQNKTTIPCPREEISDEKNNGLVERYLANDDVVRGSDADMTSSDRSDSNSVAML